MILEKIYFINKYLIPQNDTNGMKLLQNLPKKVGGIKMTEKNIRNTIKNHAKQELKKIKRRVEK